MPAAALSIARILQVKCYKKQKIFQITEEIFLKGIDKDFETPDCILSLKVILLACDAHSFAASVPTYCSVN